MAIHTATGEASRVYSSSLFVMKVSIHTASRISWVANFVGLGLGLACQASRAYLRRLSKHMAMGEASRVYSIRLLLFTSITKHLIGE